LSTSQHCCAIRRAGGQSVGHTHTASAALEGSTDPVRPSMVMDDPARIFHRKSTGPKVTGVMADPADRVVLSVVSSPVLSTPSR